MDTITQGLLGAVTAQLGFRHKIGRDATWVAIGAAVLPDLDTLVTPVLSMTGAESGGMDYVIYHRALTHSVLAIPVMSAVIAAAWWWGRRRYAGLGRDREGGADRPEKARPFWLLYGCVLAAMLSHPLLDLVTTYGTQLLAPVTDRRFAVDAMPIIDMFYTPLLLATLLVAWIVRLVKRSVAVRATLAIAWIGFALSCGYIGTGYLLGRQVEDKARRLAGEENVIEANAYPVVGSIFLWRAVVETDGAWITARARPWGEIDAGAVRRTAKAEPNVWIRRACRLEAARMYDWFALGRLRAEYRKIDGTHVVLLHDMRYGWPPASPTSLWPLRVEFSGEGELLGVERIHPSRARGNLLSLLGDVWAENWRP